MCLESDQDVQPLVVTQPTYPLTATLLCQQGAVGLAFTIQANGRITEAEITHSEPPGVFDQAALKAVSDWRFRPRCRAGVPVDREAVQRIEFKLDLATTGPCPELDDPEALEVLAELVSHYSILAEQMLLHPEDVPDWSSPALRFSGDYGQIERFHYELIASFLNRWQDLKDQQVFTGQLDFFDANRLAADPDLDQTLPSLLWLRENLIQTVDELAAQMERDRERMGRLRERVDVESDVWMALVARFVPDQQTSDFELNKMRANVDHTINAFSALIDFLHRNRDQWTPRAEAPHFPKFETPEFESMHRVLHGQATDAVSQLVDLSMNSLLTWSNPEL